jgi:hypothetical protein
MGSEILSWYVLSLKLTTFLAFQLVVARLRLLLQALGRYLRDVGRQLVPREAHQCCDESRVQVRPGRCRNPTRLCRHVAEARALSPAVGRCGSFVVRCHWCRPPFRVACWLRVSRFVGVDEGHQRRLRTTDPIPHRTRGRQGRRGHEVALPEQVRGRSPRTRISVPHH